jgi:hypothetical protein
MTIARSTRPSDHRGWPGSGGADLKYIQKAMADSSITVPDEISAHLSGSESD